MILRPAKLADIDKLVQFSSALDSGMTSLPNDATTWEKKLIINEASAQASAAQPTGDIYLFLLEQDQKVIGTTAIYAGVGLNKPFYSYKLSTRVAQSDVINRTVTTRMLHLVNDFTGATELASLYILPNFRVRNAGRFLSKSRFLMIHQFPERFDSLIFAELRGRLDQHGDSLFWRSLGEKFFNMPFNRADFISAVNGSQFISDLMPKHPVYLDLLPKAAQEVVGQCNENSKPAQRLLEQEGFQWKGYVDIFDAGPSMQCDRQHIEILKKVIRCEITGTHNKPLDPNAPHYILSNHQLMHYRLACTPVDLRLDTTNDQQHYSAILPEHILNTLELSIGDCIDLMPMKTI